MPISKNTHKKVCVNNCGKLVLQFDETVDSFYAFALSVVSKTEDEEMFTDGRRIFTVSVYMCPECGYIELYDK